MNLIDKIEELEHAYLGIQIEDFSKRNLFVKEYLNFIEDSKIKQNSKWSLDKYLSGEPDIIPGIESIDGCIKSNLIYYYKFDDNEKKFYFIISIISNKYIIFSEYYVFNIFEDKYQEFKNKIISFGDKKCKLFCNKSDKEHVLEDLTNKYDKYVKDKNSLVNVIDEEDYEFNVGALYDLDAYDPVEEDDEIYAFTHLYSWWDQAIYIWDLFDDEKDNPSYVWDFLEELAEDITEFLINNKYSELDTAKKVYLEP